MAYLASSADELRDPPEYYPERQKKPTTPNAVGFFQQYGQLLIGFGLGWLIFRRRGQ
jgi:hypothetical protein